MADTRRPIHLGVIVGLSAGAYAVSLAGVTGLQSARDAATAAERAPASEAAARLDALHTDLERRVVAAGAAYDAAAAAYAELAAGLGTFDGRLQTLAGAVSAIEGTSVSLPTSVAVPHVSKAAPVARAAAAPAVHGTTSASGH
jgi:hypothetical protein